MKILAASDIHGDKRHAEKLAEQAFQEKVDLVVLCGDLLFNEMESDGLMAPFKKRNLAVALIPGNHETSATTNFLAEFYKLYNLHGYYLKLGDVGIFGCGGGNVAGHAYQINEEDITKILKKGHDKIKDMKTQIMVTHIHPSGGLIEKMSFKGSPAIAKALEDFKPNVHLCGHIHECEGMEEIIKKTRVMNVGKKGKIIEV